MKKLVLNACQTVNNILLNSVLKGIGGGKIGFSFGLIVLLFVAAACSEESEGDAPTFSNQFSLSESLLQGGTSEVDYAQWLKSKPWEVTLAGCKMGQFYVDMRHTGTFFAFSDDSLLVSTGQYLGDLNSHHVEFVVTPYGQYRYQVKNDTITIDQNTFIATITADSLLQLANAEWMIVAQPQRK